jgi:hypothetical protein
MLGWRRVVASEQAFEDSLLHRANPMFWRRLRYHRPEWRALSLVHSSPAPVLCRSELWSIWRHAYRLRTTERIAHARAAQHWSAQRRASAVAVWRQFAAQRRHSRTLMEQAQALWVQKALRSTVLLWVSLYAFYLA